MESSSSGSIIMLIEKSANNGLQLSEPGTGSGTCKLAPILPPLNDSRSGLTLDSNWNRPVYNLHTNATVSKRVWISTKLCTRDP